MVAAKINMAHEKMQLWIKEIRFQFPLLSGITWIEKNEYALNVLKRWIERKLKKLFVLFFRCSPVWFYSILFQTFVLKFLFSWMEIFPCAFLPIHKIYFRQTEVFFFFFFCFWKRFECVSFLCIFLYRSSFKCFIQLEPKSYLQK